MKRVGRPTETFQEMVAAGKKLAHSGWLPAMLDLERRKRLRIGTTTLSVAQSICVSQDLDTPRLSLRSTPGLSPPEAVTSCETRGILAAFLRAAAARGYRQSDKPVSPPVLFRRTAGARTLLLGQFGAMSVLPDI